MKRIGFSKENSYCSMKHLKKKIYIYCCLQKIPDPYNAKKHYQSIIRKKNTNQ